MFIVNQLRRIKGYNDNRKQATFETYLEAVAEYKRIAAETAASQSTVAQAYSLVQLFEGDSKLHEVEMHSYNSAWQ